MVSFKIFCTHFRCFWDFNKEKGGGGVGDSMLSQKLRLYQGKAASLKTDYSCREEGTRKKNNGKSGPLNEMRSSSKQTDLHNFDHFFLSYMCVYIYFDTECDLKYFIDHKKLKINHKEIFFIIDKS